MSSKFLLLSLIFARKYTICSCMLHVPLTHPKLVVRGVLCTLQCILIVSLVARLRRMGIPFHTAVLTS
jgi:hypothetical protein